MNFSEEFKLKITAFLFQVLAYNLKVFFVNRKQFYNWWSISFVISITAKNSLTQMILWLLIFPRLVELEKFNFPLMYQYVTNFLSTAAQIQLSTEQEKKLTEWSLPSSFLLLFDPLLDFSWSPVPTEDIPQYNSFQQNFYRQIFTNSTRKINWYLQSYNFQVCELGNKANKHRPYFLDRHIIIQVSCCMHFALCLTAFLSSFFFVEDSKQGSFLIQNLNS